MTTLRNIFAASMWESDRYYPSCYNVTAFKLLRGGRFIFEYLSEADEIHSTLGRFGDGMDFSEELKGFYFDSEERCQAFCDWLNERMVVIP